LLKSSAPKRHRLPKDGFDVAVLGGGPGGAATALALRQLGHSVVVIERSNYEKVRIGETLPPSIKRFLVKLGVWDLFVAQNHRPAVGIRSAWGHTELYDNDLIDNPYGHGWHIDRARFDEMLVLAAGQAGAHVYRGAQLVSYVQDREGDWRLDIISGAECKHLKARFVVDATGRLARIARRQGVKRTAIDRLIAVVGFFSAARKQSADHSTLIEASENGWWYSALLPGSRIVAAYMTDADLDMLAQRRRLRHWEDQLRITKHIKARIGYRSLDAELRVFAANTSRIEQFTGRNWLAVGDAAFTFDPLSAQGVFKALHSGLRAGRLINAHFKGAKSALLDYAASLEEEFDVYLSLRAYYYRREIRWPDSVFWQRRAFSPASHGHGQDVLAASTHVDG
jgi:flavin-dependent dehydrogenase